MPLACTPSNASHPAHDTGRPKVKDRPWPSGLSRQHAQAARETLWDRQPLRNPEQLRHRTMRTANAGRPQRARATSHRGPPGLFCPWQRQHQTAGATGLRGGCSQGDFRFTPEALSANTQEVPPLSFRSQGGRANLGTAFRPCCAPAGARFSLSFLPVVSQ